MDKFEFLAGCLVAAGKVDEVVIGTMEKEFSRLDTAKKGYLTVDQAKKVDVLRLE